MLRCFIRPAPFQFATAPESNSSLAKAHHATSLFFSREGRPPSRVELRDDALSSSGVNINGETHTPEAGRAAN
jgi:hypothetical protein